MMQIGIGFYAVLFTTILVILICVFNSKIKKILNNYYFLTFLSLFCLSWFIIFRWAPDITFWIKNNYLQKGYNYQVLISKIFLLDLCPFLGMFLPLSIMFDKTKNCAKVLSVFGIIGPGITLYGQIAFETLSFNTSGKTISITEYLFFNKLYFFMHFYVFIFSFIILLNAKEFSWYSFINAHLFIIVYFLYLMIFIYGYGIDQNVTGLAQKDWSKGGEYYKVAQIFNLSFPYAPIVCFSLVWIWAILIMFLKNGLTFDLKNKILNSNDKKNFLLKPINVQKWVKSFLIKLKIL